MPTIGKFIVMLEPILTKFILLLFSIIPLLVAFTIATKMIFFNQSSFVTVTKALHKSSSMTIGEFDYETLFFSEVTLTAATFIFIPFIVIMAIVFMNLLLGIAVGDIKISMKNASTRASTYKNSKFSLSHLSVIDRCLEFIHKGHRP